MAEQALAKEFRKGSYRCAKCNSLLYKSEDKFRSVGKWAAFRKSATPESITLVEDDFGGSDIQCGTCKATVGNLYHDGKKSGDDHAEAKDRHCVESNAVTFEAVDLDEPAPEAPAEPSRQISLAVQETTEAPTTMPAGMTQPSSASKVRSSQSRVAPSTPGGANASSAPSTPAGANAPSAASTPATPGDSGLRNSRRTPARSPAATNPAQQKKSEEEAGLSTTVLGVVAVAVVAVVGVGAWFGWRRATKK